MLCAGYKRICCWHGWLAFPAVVVILIYAFAVHAATNSFPRYNVRVWQVDDGLPQNSVWAITQSKDGYLWVGTQQGLARFDGMRFVSLENKAAPELKHAYITALCTGKDGSLWIGCSGSGLYRMREIRAATSRGLSGISKEGDVSTVNFGLRTPANILKSVCEDDGGNIWVASNEGVICAQEQRRIPYGLSEGLPDRIATVLFKDRQGRIWAGTYSGLAGLADGKVISTPLNEAGLGERIYAMFEDREENLWVGAQDGLYRLKPARFRTYTTQEGLTFNNVMSVYEDETAAVWIATWGGGVNLLKDEKITPVGRSAGLTHDKALALHQGRDGSLWVGMDHGGGLNRLDLGQNGRASRQSGLIDAAIRVVYDDHRGALWVGTRSGLNIIRDGTVETYTTANGLPANNVWVISEDTAGNVWVGTDAGLMRWNQGKFVTFTTRDGLLHSVVDALYEDSDDTLWIGTRGGGLNRLKAGQFTGYSTKQGLFSDEIYEILEDDSGYFWMSCRSGIFRVRKKDFDELDNGKLKMVSCVSFGKVDGLASVQCNGVAKPAGWKGKEGRLWFATIRGVVRVESAIQSNDQAPPVVIEEAILDRKTRREMNWELNKKELQEPLRVPPGRGELEVHYTALSLRAPEKNRFKYMLEGLDPDWIDAGNRREAVYNNIGHGSYRFRVIACNNDGVWNETGATLSLVFLPHFWQTWWFKVVVAAPFALLLWFWYHLRVSRMRAIERLRVQIAADLHDDVGSRLTKVAMVTELVDRQTQDQDRVKPQIQKIATTTREVIQAMDEIVWTINPKNDTLDNLANYIFQYAQEYFQNTAVRCRLDLPARLPDMPLSTEERHNLFMAFKEALNNVLKHAGATEVRIGLTLRADRLMISITDNGCGFTSNGSHSSGNGLTNMKNRLKQIGGVLNLESKPGAGTKLEMEAPLK